MGAFRGFRLVRQLAVMGVLLCLLAVVPLRCQQASPAPASPAPSVTTNPEFLAIADQVMNEMSEITGWKLKSPLKKSIRTREQIRAYIISEMNDEKDARERYASARSAEIFGLIPKGFNLDTFLVDLLTEQIAGLYDPKEHEFYIADWIQPDEQRMVMSHELTHALQDQYFHIEAWSRAAKPNDDAELARDSVLEGSATAGMLEYELRDKGIKLRELPDFDPSAFIGDLGDSPLLKKAPAFIKDSLMFPYFDGLRFSMSILRTGGWNGFDAVFANPPASTQQIMHPDLYRGAIVPLPIKVDLPNGVPGDGWNKLEENCMGEFGWREVLKLFLDEDRAGKLAFAWNGDDYATFEQKDTKHLMLFTRTRFNSERAARSFFDAYAEALKTKYPQRTPILNAQEDLEFDTPDGGVFFQCVDKECITLEGGDEKLFSRWTKKLAWPLPSPSRPNPGISIATIRAERSTATDEHVVAKPNARLQPSIGLCSAVQNHQREIVGLLGGGRKIADLIQACAQQRVWFRRGVFFGQRLNAAHAKFIPGGIKHFSEPVGV